MYIWGIVYLLFSENVERDFDGTILEAEGVGLDLEVERLEDAKLNVGQRLLME